MLKVHQTRKDITNRFKTVYCVGYCRLQQLLTAYNPSYYNAGTYGWNWDAYIVDYDTCIVTGYGNLTGYHVPYEISEKYENLAEKICDESRWDYEKRNEQLQALMQDFLQAVKESKQC